MASTLSIMSFAVTGTGCWNPCDTQDLLGDKADPFRSIEACCSQIALRLGVNGFPRLHNVEKV